MRRPLEGLLVLEFAQFLAGPWCGLRLADLGKEVILVEKRDRPGGTCLLEGCIPSKTLIHAVEVKESALAAAAFGLECQGQAQCHQAGEVNPGDYGRIVRIKLDAHDRRIFVPTPHGSPSWQRGYNRRSALERINNRIDRHFGFEQNFIRGIAKMTTRVGLAIAVMMAMPSSSSTTGSRRNGMRRKRPLMLSRSVSGRMVTTFAFMKEPTVSPTGLWWAAPWTTWTRRSARSCCCGRMSGCGS